MVAVVNNRGLIDTKGIDTQITYQTDLPSSLSLFSDYAQFGFTAYWTHLLEFRWQDNPVSTIVDCAGLFGNFCADGVTERIGVTRPNDMVTTQFNYGADNWTLLLTWRWIGGATNDAATEADFFGEPQPLLAIPEIGSKNYLDLGFNYVFNDSWSGRIGIYNLLDTSAPLMADASSENNTDSLLYDVFGRSFYLSLSARLFQ